jgi:hypothetical protein
MVESFTPNTDAQVASAFTPEQEASLIADGSLPKAQAVHAHADTATPTETGHTDDLILGKFRTQEDLEKAYQSLEQKLSSGSTEAGSTLGDLIAAAGEHFNEHGAMTEEQYKQFEDNGISREYVDRYVSGIKAQSDAETATLLGTIGGQNNFDQMSEWMGGNLPETEVSAYNNVIDKGTNDEVAVLLQGMYARYKAATGAGHTTVQGTVTSAPAGYRSRSEVMAAMSDPKYGRDPAFRADVERKLSVTPNTVF